MGLTKKKKHDNAAIILKAKENLLESCKVLLHLVPDCNHIAPKLRHGSEVGLGEGVTYSSLPLHSWHLVNLALKENWDLLCYLTALSRRGPRNFEKGGLKAPFSILLDKHYANFHVYVTVDVGKKWDWGWESPPPLDLCLVSSKGFGMLQICGHGIERAGRCKNCQLLQWVYMIQEGLQEKKCERP